MSYIDVTKKEAKKLLSLLKSKTKENLYDLSKQDNVDALNILAMAKGFSGYSHFQRELQNPIKNQDAFADSVFQFSKDDVVNDIYPEFVKYVGSQASKKVNSVEPVCFLNTPITNGTVLFCEHTDKPLSSQLTQLEKGLLVMGQDINRKQNPFKEDVTVSVYPREKQTTVDPINPFRHQINSLYRLVHYKIDQWLQFNLSYDDDYEARESKLVLKSFKGLFNLNYLVKLKNYHTVEYIRSIGIGEDNIISDEAVKKHLFYSRQGLIFAQMMIDYPHCFSEASRFNIQENIEQANVLIEIVDATRTFEEESLYTASKILKKMVFHQLYNEHQKCPYSLIALFNIHTDGYSLRNTILINNKEHMPYVKTSKIQCMVIDKLKNDNVVLPIELKKFILASGQHKRFLNLKPQEKIVIKATNNQ